MPHSIHGHISGKICQLLKQVEIYNTDKQKAAD